MSGGSCEQSVFLLLKYADYSLLNPELGSCVLPSAEIAGFKVCVKPGRDGASIVVCNDSSEYTRVTRLYRSDGTTVGGDAAASVRLTDVLDLPYKIVNVELVGEHGWKQALAAVEASGALGRVIFSSLEHGEVFQLWFACREARCGLAWEDSEAEFLTHEMLSYVPPELKVCISMQAVLARRDFWESHKARLVISGVADLSEASLLGFKPSILVVDHT